MRLVRAFVLAALTTAVAAGFIGVSSASALKTTQLCKVHTGLVCPAGEAATEDHQVLPKGTVWRLLTNEITILCLGALKEATPLGLAKPQLIHTLKLELTGCGTDDSHDNCIVRVEELPLLRLLKTGLDTGVLTALDGSLIVECPNLGFDCLFDLAGAQFTMGDQHTTVEDVPITPLGGPFFCPNEALLDYLLVTLEDKPHYILQ